MQLHFLKFVAHELNNKANTKVFLHITLESGGNDTYCFMEKSEADIYMCEFRFLAIFTLWSLNFSMNWHKILYTGISKIAQQWLDGLYLVVKTNLK